MIRPAAIAGRTLDASNPIDWSHPLNRALVSDWTVLPSTFYGGAYLRDLAFGKKPIGVGTLTNGPLWRSAIGKERASGLLYDDTASHFVNIPHSTRYDFNHMTIEAVVYITAVPGIGGWIVDKANGSVRNYELFVNTSGQPNIGSTSGGGVTGHLATGSYVLTVGQLTHLVGRYNGAALDIFANGINCGTSSVSTTFDTVTDDVQIGSLASLGILCFPGFISSIRLRNAALTDAEVANVYLDWATGSQQRYNWLSTRAFFGVSASFDAATFQHFPTNSPHQPPVLVEAY